MTKTEYDNLQNALSAHLDRVLSHSPLTRAERIAYENAVQACKSVVSKNVVKEAEPATTTSFTTATWIKDKEDCYWGNSFIRRYCSNCGKSPYFDRETGKYMYSLYCPNCGAKMEEKTNDAFSN